MIRARFPCDSVVFRHFDRGIQWVTRENKHFVFSLMANSSSNSAARRLRAMRDCCPSVRSADVPFEQAVGLAGIICFCGAFSRPHGTMGGYEARCPSVKTLGYYHEVPTGQGIAKANERTVAPS